MQTYEMYLRQSAPKFNTLDSYFISKSIKYLKGFMKEENRPTIKTKIKVEENQLLESILDSEFYRKW